MNETARDLLAAVASGALAPRRPRHAARRPARAPFEDLGSPASTTTAPPAGLPGGRLRPGKTPAQIAAIAERIVAGATACS
jgi:hypothetical protein